jgi:hypothetical protein
MMVKFAFFLVFSGLFFMGFGFLIVFGWFDSDWRG